MTEVAPHALAAARAELARLRELSSELPPLPVEVGAPVVVVTVAAPAAGAAAPAAPAAPPAPAATAAGGLPLTESERARLARVEASVRECSEVNERVMAQNIALLADLEAAQRAVRELRAGKDALAVQLRRAMLAAQRGGGTPGAATPTV